MIDLRVMKRAKAVAMSGAGKAIMQPIVWQVEDGQPAATPG
ncbi:ABC-type molybdenum transport system ATPase subunit/photorepair protein PhrA [Sphingomonas zeicaulis]